MRKLVSMTAVVLAACGVKPVALDDYEGAAREAYCEYFVRCGAIEDLASCRKLEIGLATDLSHLSASDRAAIEAGKIDYDGESVTLCLDALAGRSCDLTSKSNRVPPESCRNILTGTLHEGDDCTYNTECISRQCEAPECGMACCTGSCVGDVAPPRAKAGESCEAALCDDASFCDKDIMTCTALKPRDAFCVSGAECRYGLDCSQAVGCTALPTLGQSCTGPCRDEGTTCAGGTCVKLAYGGEACGPGTQCARAYQCDTTRHCSAGLALGAECAAGQRCADDSAFCDVPQDAVSGRCALPKLDGARCVEDRDCASQTCDLLSSMCVAEPVCI